MKAVIRFQEEQDAVTSRLDDLGVTKEQLKTIIHKAVGAWNDAVIIDPCNTPGLLAYIYGTRAIREEFLPKGWVMDRKNNVEATFNPIVGIKLIYQNVDKAADELCEPRALSKKGNAMSQMVNAVQLQLPCMFENQMIQQNNNSNIWFLCVSIDNGNVRAELSRPKMISQGQFNGFSERIFIIDDTEEFDNIESLLNKDDNQIQDEFEINISRK